MRYDLCCVFYNFCIFYPQNYLGYFDQAQFHSSTTLIFCEGNASNLKCYRFWKFEKYRIFHFGQFLMLQKNLGYFAIADYVISRHISRCTFRIYIFLYGFKLFLIRYVGLKQKKREIFAIFAFLPFLDP